MLEPMPKRSWTTLLAALGCLVALAAPAHAADGDLDPSFGGDGLAATDRESYEIRTAVLPDGRIVAGGTTPADSIWVGRFLPNGDPDPSFGDGGYVTFGSPLYGLDGLELQADGRIVLLGHPDPSGDGIDVTVARLLTDGALDPSFGEGGITRFDFAGATASSGSALAIQPNGRILVAGSAARDFNVARLTASGTLDETFSGDGSVSEDLGGDVETVAGIALQGSRIVVGGNTNGRRDTSPEGLRAAVLALTASGARDNSFSGDGVFVGAADTRASDIIRTQDGHVLLSGTAGGGTTKWGFLKLSGSGSPDPSFGSGGTLVLDLGSAPGTARAATTTADGRVAAVGVQGARVAIAKFTLRGQPVTPFGDGGHRIYEGLDGGPLDITRQPDGKLVFGFARLGVAATLARVHDDGSDPNVPQPPAPQPPRLELTAGSAVEGQVLPFTATLSRPHDQPVTFSYVTGEGSAATNRDFAGRRGTVTIPPGQTSATIGIPTNSDRLFENDEIFRVELYDAQNARFGEYVAFGTIVNELRSGRCQNIVRGRGKGTDILTGSPAGDTIEGLQDLDFLFGLGGDDCIYGHRHHDIMDGGDGHDLLDGGSGNDRMKGGSGNDRLIGRRGRNRYNGESGNDTIYSRNGVAEIVECGPGRDVVKADAKDRLRNCERRAR
jgi:uncharacterized delta-60 repeat protein